MDLSGDCRAYVGALVKYLHTLKYTAIPVTKAPATTRRQPEYHVRTYVHHSGQVRDRVAQEAANQRSQLSATGQTHHWSASV